MNTRLSVAFALATLVPLAVACGGDTTDTSGTSAATGSDAAAPTATTTVTATATPTVSLGGTVTGLAGTGLALTDGSETLAVAKDGTFTFSKARTAGATFEVTVASQPSGPSQQCTVTNGTGTVGSEAITNVAVACKTRAFAVGGTVTGLAGAGLVLQDNAGDDLAVAASGTFAFPSTVASGAPFSVTVKTQPAGQTCSVAGGSGTIGSGDVTSVTVNCATNHYTLGGTVSGLSGTVLLGNGVDRVAVAASGAFAFPTTLVQGDAFAVTVVTQPSGPAQTCTVTEGAGVIDGADVASVVVACTTNTYAVGVSVSGVGGAGLVLQDKGGDDLAVDADGDHAFATAVTDGQPYAVTVLAAPPGQRCSVANGSGLVAGADVAGITVTCEPIPSYTVTVTVTGLQGAGLVLQDDGGDDLPVAIDGDYTFATAILDGQPYAVTVLTDPSGPDQVCTVGDGAAGAVAGANVANIVVTCQ